MQAKAMTMGHGGNRLRCLREVSVAQRGFYFVLGVFASIAVGVGYTHLASSQYTGRTAVWQTKEKAIVGRAYAV